MHGRDDPTFTRRSILMGALQGGVALGLLGRLYWLQVSSNEHYKMLSDHNRLSVELLPPLRGQIFDRTGRILIAGNKTIHHAIFRRDLMQGDAPKDRSRGSLEHAEAVLGRTADLLSLTHIEREDLLESARTFMKTHAKSAPFIIKSLLSWEDVARLELHGRDLPGVHVQEGYERFYPDAKAFCHIVGHVGRVQAKDLEALEGASEYDTAAHALKNLLKQHPYVRIGKTGVEKLFDTPLIGSPGVQNVEVNATRQVVRVLSKTPPVHGEDFKLSIDANLQTRIYDRLVEHNSASAVVMHIPSGGLLAAVSTPSYDTNVFTDRIPKDIWDDIVKDPHTPLVSKFSQGQYAPGSVFKMVVMLAGLRSGVITPKTTFHCGGYHELSGHRFHCHLKGGHGSVDPYMALVKSCDVFFYRMSLLCGADAIAQAARDFGFGSITSLNFPNEKAGLIPSKTWKEKVRGKGWTPAETINMSIGQGYVLATPLQMCVMTARFASKGQRVEPHLTLPSQMQDDVTIPQGRPECLIPSRVFDSMGEDPAHMDLIYKSMTHVMQAGGTAYGARSTIHGIEFAGKTGTSQVRRITMHDRKHNLHKSWPWHWRDHAVFVGFAPVDNPLYAISVVVEHGGSGGRVAAPLGRDLLSDAFECVGYPSKVPLQKKNEY